MNTLTTSQLNIRANAEGLSFAAIKAAIIKAGESLKTHGYTYGPIKIKLSDLPRYNGLYRNMVWDAAPGIKTWEEVTSPFPEFAWPAVYEFHAQNAWGAMQNGTAFIVPLEYKTWWCRKIDNDTLVIDKMYCEAAKQWEEQYMFLPPGIRAATAAIVGADPTSSTFHSVFDAIVGGYAIY